MPEDVTVIKTGGVGVSQTLYLLLSLGSTPVARQIPSNRLLKTSFSSRTPPEKNRDDMIFFQSIIRRLNKQELIHFESIRESMAVRRGHFKGC